jgi:hypothetical protein
VTRFRILLQTDEDGLLVATCHSLPGSASQGATRSEAVATIPEAMATRSSASTEAMHLGPTHGVARWTGTE